MLDVSGKAYSISGTALREPDQDLLSFADTLLRISSNKQPYFLISAGTAAYFAVLVVALTVDFSPPPMTLEAPVEMAYEELATPEEQPEPVPEQLPEPPPPPVAEKPPEPIPEQPPPPPPEAEALPEPAPVAEVPPPKEPEPKPEPEPEPKLEEPAKPVEVPKPEKPKAKPRAATTGAVPSDYANKVFQRINRIASSSFPRGALTQKTVRIGYVIVIGASGQLISKSISASGIAALDQAVSQALARSAPFPAPPNLGAASYRISGAIVYRVR